MAKYSCVTKSEDIELSKCDQKISCIVTIALFTK